MAHPMYTRIRRVAMEAIDRLKSGTNQQPYAPDAHTSTSAPVTAQESFAWHEEVVVACADELCAAFDDYAQKQGTDHSMETLLTGARLFLARIEQRYGGASTDETEPKPEGTASQDALRQPLAVPEPEAAQNTCVESTPSFHEPAAAEPVCADPVPGSYQWVLTHAFTVSTSGREWYCTRCLLEFGGRATRTVSRPFLEA
jgi:hypothetical protein